MRFASSNTSFGDAKEPPDPGLINSTLSTSTASSTQESTSLSTSNKRFREFYINHTLLHQPLNCYNLQIQLQLGITATVTDDLIYPTSIQSFQHNIHIHLIKANSTVKETKKFLREFYYQIRPLTDGRNLHELHPQMRIIIGKYILFYRPSFTVFKQTLSDLRTLLTLREFCHILTDILHHDWTTGGIKNKMKIDNIKSLAASYQSSLPPHHQFSHPYSSTVFAGSNQSNTSFPLQSNPIEPLPSYDNTTTTTTVADTASASPASVSNPLSNPSKLPYNDFFIHHFNNPPIYNAMHFSSTVTDTLTSNISFSPSLHTPIHTTSKVNTYNDTRKMHHRNNNPFPNHFTDDIILTALLTHSPNFI